MSLVSNKPITWVAFLGKKALLTALPTVGWLLITAGEEGGCCWTPEQVPSVGLVLTWVLLQDRDGSLHGMLSPWQLLPMISGLSAKDCCWQGNITNICDQWGLHRWMESCFPFPGLNLDGVLPMGQVTRGCFPRGWRESTGVKGGQVAGWATQVVTDSVSSAGCIIQSAAVVPGLWSM